MTLEVLVLQSGCSLVQGNRFFQHQRRAAKSLRLNHSDVCEGKVDIPAVDNTCTAKNVRVMGLEKYQGCFKWLSMVMLEDSIGECGKCGMVPSRPLNSAGWQHSQLPQVMAHSS